MRRGSKNSRKKRHTFKLGSLLCLFLFLCLVWIWKANKVGAYYHRLGVLEKEKRALATENAQHEARLAELKSIENVHYVVSIRFGLTQEVSERVFLIDPVHARPIDRSTQFVDDFKIPDWIEEAVFGTDAVYAKQNGNVRSD